MTPRVVPALALALAVTAHARSPHREVVSFSVTTNTGAGRSEFVVGSHPDVGNWNPTGAVKLYWTAGDVWTGQVAVQAGTVLEYKFITRETATNRYCDNGNAEWMGGPNLTTSVPAQPDAPYAGKTVFYHSGWTNAFVLWHSNTDWISTPMTRLGAGRVAGEYLYRADGIGEAGEDLEFIPYGSLGGVQYWDHAPYGGFGDSNYYTSLDAFFLQDGNVFGYWPPASVSVSRIVTTNVTSSWAPTIPSRDIRIYLPRGYDQNAWKRYPVLYLHDGQNVFQPGGAFGCWYAELSADKEISQGRMREAILVGVDNHPTNRLGEYCPPGDTARGSIGIADVYGNFLIHNVRPTVDTHYRTLNDRSNTLTLGSSMGGLVSLYLGLETNVFGRLGVVSPAFWTATNFVGRVDSSQTKGVIVYMDMGTEEGSEMWDDAWQVYDLLLQDGYAPNEDLEMAIGCGHPHSEWAWAERMPGMYRYLLHVRDEPNLIAQDLYPPVIGQSSATTVSFNTLKGRDYRLDRSAELSSLSWSGIATGAVESLPWATRTLTDTNPPPAGAFYRVAAEPWP